MKQLTNHKIYFLEGLPGSGKTTLLTDLAKRKIKIIPEILFPEQLKKHCNMPNQTFFFNNDEKKIEIARATKDIVLIDRSPLSTLFFNLAMVSTNPKANPNKAIQWYVNKFDKLFRNNSPFYFLFIDISPELSLHRKKRSINLQDPWSNPKLLKFIGKIFK